MFYPIFVNLSGRRVLVVGGGPVAQRKVEGLLQAGAQVTVVSPDVTDELRSRPIDWKQREFADSDVEGMMLVISATDDVNVQKRVVEAARRCNVLVNTVDQPALCDFIVPAVARRDDVVGAISTSGQSPALAAVLRARLEELLSEDVGRAAKILGQIRNEVHRRTSDSAARKRIFEQILESGLLEWIRECDDDEAIRRVREVIEA